MEFWEFLIQKEGDRSWLPLDSPDVEILEGRYRVVARFSRVNTPVDIRVSQTILDEDPPKRRTQKRASQTNQDGLVVVIPFTRLQPGVWELQCSSDLMADFMGDSWQRAVKLRVLSHANIASDEWEGDWQVSTAPAQSHLDPSGSTYPPIPDPQPQPDPVSEVNAAPGTVLPAVDNDGGSETLDRIPTIDPAVVPPAAAASKMDAQRADAIARQVADQIARLTNPSENTVPATDPEIIASDLFQEAAQMSEQVVDSIFREIDATIEQTLDSEPLLDPEAIAPPATTDSDNPAIPPLQLILDRETCTVRRDEALTLTGRIELLLPEDTVVAVPAMTLQVKLRNPQTATVLVEVFYPLPAGQLPLVFDCSLPMPTGQETRLMVGEIALLPSPLDDATVLANHGFTVTVELNELLEAIANSVPESDLVTPPLEFAAPPPPKLNLTFLELVNSPQPALSQFQPTGKQVLPPQLYQPDTAQPKVKSLQLPFARVPSTQTTGEIGDREAIASPPAPDLPPALDGSEPEASLPDTPPLPAPTLASVDRVDSVVEDPSSQRADWFTDDDVVSPQAWHSLDGEAVSEQGDLSQESPEASPAELAFRSLNLQTRFLSRLNALASDRELPKLLRLDRLEPLVLGDAPLGLDTDLAATEVVVEEDSSVTTTAVEEEKRIRPATTVIEPPPSLVLPEDEPVPTPQLHIPHGELVSGDSVFVTVQLPELKPRIYVKLWLWDRQARALLDGPRWLVAFVPNGLGQQETRMQLTVPHGCLEVQFEAIAVEVTTHRESRKVAISRSVIPPDLPVMSLDGLDI